jgi:BMFP domain-containing protein YqiC
MSNSEKLLKTLSGLIENGILTSKDLKKEISTDLKFTRDKLINKFQLVSREEFEVLKKLVLKQELALKKISKKNKSKKVKKS